jgi:hypothetical protein
MMKEERQGEIGVKIVWSWLLLIKKIELIMGEYSTAATSSNVRQCVFSYQIRNGILGRRITSVCHDIIAAFINVLQSAV